MDKTKCITFDMEAQEALPDHIKAKMKADRDKIKAEQPKLYAYCKRSYVNDNLAFDAGYIEAVKKGQRFETNNYWRYATKEEIEKYFDTPYLRRPRGRYLANR